MENTDFLQAVSLLATYARRVGHVQQGNEPAQAPGVSCKRRDILRLRLADYVEQAPKVEVGLLWAAGFLAQQHVFAAADLPYPSQLVPLAAIRAILGQDADTHAADRKLRRWYWSGVLGELYGGSLETRFARDLEQVVAWVRGDGGEPLTVSEASFQIRMVEAAAGIRGDELDQILQTHLVDPDALRSADFKAFFADRRQRLLTLIGEAMGKRVMDTEAEDVVAYESEAEDPADSEMVDA